MSFARAVSALIARSSRTLRVESEFSSFCDLSCRRKHITSKVHRSTMQYPFDPTTIHCHHALAKDVFAVFRAYERDEKAGKLRQEAFEKLRRLIHGLGADGEYDLVDSSFESLSGFPRPLHAPLECTIIDKARPGGLPPSFEAAPLPVAYDAIALGKYLSENGYIGSFVDTRPDILGPNGRNPGVQTSRLNLPPEPTWGQLAAPMSSLFNTLPPILRIKSDSMGHPEILLNPVHPSNELRLNIITYACESSEVLRMLAPLFWLWLKSHGVEHYSITTCFFLVMFYLQDRHRLGPHEVHGSQQPLQGYWNRIERGSKPQYEQLFIRPMPQIANPAIHLGPLIADFFTFWASNKYLPYSRILDPLSGLHVPRTNKYNTNIRNMSEVRVMEDLQSKSAKDSRDAYWEYQALVLIDPILGYHNLAHMVTKEALERMINKSQVSARTLRRGLPLTEVFGPEFPPPALAPIVGQGGEGLTDLQETAPSTQVVSQVPISSGGSQMQRMYHTSARIETRFRVHPAIRVPSEVPRSVLSSRERTISLVQRAIRERYGNQYMVECFGSTQYGVDSPTSDLDLVVLDEDRKTGFAPEIELETLPNIYNVRNLARTLERTGFRVTRVVAHASVPIVKFEDTRTRLSCDININDRLGLFNTRLVAQYCALFPLLRPLLMMVKKWAKTLGLNDPSGEGGTTTFSSYALTLMTVGFLQAHELLPNLQAGLPPLTPEEEFWICGKDGRRARCDPRFDKSPTWKAESNILIYDLRGALISWFRFWGHQFNYPYDIMSIRDGGVIPRAEKSRETLAAEKEMERKGKKAEKKEKWKAERRTGEGGKGKKAVANALDDGEGKKEVFNKGREDEGNEGDGGIGEGGRRSPVHSASESEPGADAEIEGQVAAEERLEDEDADAAVDDVDQAAAEEMDEADLQHGQQPRSWLRSALVVADPFIVSKNATGAIIPQAISHFTAECRRSLLLLSSGATFEELLGDGSALGRSGRRRKGERARGGARKRPGGAGVSDRAKDADRDTARSQERERKKQRSKERKEQRSNEKKEKREQRSKERKEKREQRSKERKDERERKGKEKKEERERKSKERKEEKERKSKERGEKREKSQSRAGSRSPSNTRDDRGKGGSVASADAADTHGKGHGSARGRGRGRGRGKGKGKEEEPVGRWTSMRIELGKEMVANAATTSTHVQTQPQASP